MTNTNKNIRAAYLILIDTLLIGIGLVVFALFHHALPQTIDGDIQILNNTVLADEADTTEYEIYETNYETEITKSDFENMFTDGEIIQTENSYISEDMNISIEMVQENDVTYYIADIYLEDYTDLMTAFAMDTYGKAFVDDTLDMSVENDAIIAISGDYYGNGEDGLVIRNGILYRDEVESDVLVMNIDGTMTTYTESDFDIDTVIENGAYQAWSFGPMLLDDGEVMQSFDASSHVLKSNPRCAIGYYEPGHYCFIVVDGRQPGYSEGVTLQEFSQIFYDLGCEVAYNMDGGKSAVMVFMDGVVNQPASGGREISDIVYIAD